MSLTGQLSSVSAMRNDQRWKPSTPATVLVTLLKSLARDGRLAQVVPSLNRWQQKTERDTRRLVYCFFNQNPYLLCSSRVFCLTPVWMSKTLFMYFTAHLAFSIHFLFYERVLNYKNLLQDFVVAENPFCVCLKWWICLKWWMRNVRCTSSVTLLCLFSVHSCFHSKHLR